MRALFSLIALVVCLAAAIDAQIAPRPDSVEEQIAALGAPDPIVRARAASCLAAMGDRAEAAVPALLKALTDTTPTDPVGCHDTLSSPGLEAARALSAIGATTATSPLLEALRSASSGVRRNAARALGGLRDARATEPLIAALRDKDPLVRQEAARALGWLQRRR
jgi:HEAT repeat protein